MIKFAFVALYSCSSTKRYKRIPCNVRGADVLYTLENLTNEVVVRIHHARRLFPTLVHRPEVHH